MPDEMVLAPVQATAVVPWQRTHVEDFLANQQSENTRLTYNRTLERYFSWCQEHGVVPAAVTMAQALAYRRDIEANYAEASGALHVSAIKAFYKMLHDTGVLPLNIWAAVKGIKAPTVSQTEALGPEQIRAIYQQAESTGPRDLLVVRLLYEVPLRREEVASLPKTALKPTPDGWVLRITGKGNKTGDVGIKDDLAHAILAQARLSEGPWLFVGRPATTHIDKRQINRIADKYGFHPHQLRHSFCTNAVDQGIDLPDISRTMRHANYNTTMRYFSHKEQVRRSASRRLTSVMDEVHHDE
jgi:integrase/recombinase XerD